VKCFSQNPDREFDQMLFSSEIEALVQLRHSCILAILGFVLTTCKSGPKLVTEFIRGVSLKTALKSRPVWLQRTTLAKIVAGIDLRMRFAHLQGCVHRNLQPSNILLDEEQLARIGDFGASRLEELELTCRSEIGTPLYTAPEMAEAEHTEKVDVFLFAMIFYELVVGKKAYPDSMLLRQVIMKICQGKRGEIPDTGLPFTKSLIERCWAGDPNTRPSFQEILHELRRNRYQIVRGVDSDEVEQFVRSVLDRERQ
jgi:serine/threonine protein kinase